MNEENFGQQFLLEAIDNHFPMESYREGQKEAIEFILRSFNSGKKVVILECPTGGGKSAIGMTVANMVKQSYYLTITKVLQDQLTRDFGDNITELKGRNAYPCTFWDRKGQTMVDKKLISSTELVDLKEKHSNCNTGYCRTKFNGGKNKSRCNLCFTKDGPNREGELSSLPPGQLYSTCPYYEQVNIAIRSPRVAMNFSSFLFQTQMTKRFEEPRDLMIIDEAHNVEPQLLEFVSLTISDFHLQSHGIFIPELETASQYAEWFADAKIHQTMFTVHNEAQNANNTWLEDDMKRTLRKYQVFVEEMKSDKNEWVCEYNTKVTNKVEHHSVTLRPVFAHNLVEPLLFKHANRVLMMSATILDVNVVCKSLGLKREEIAAHRMVNRFPKENRPIYLKNVAKMTGGKDRMNEWAPKMVDAVDKLVTKHKGQRGIIHTHNFNITDHLLKRCAPHVRKRFLSQRDFKDKAEMLEHHAQCVDSIIVAPAMHEGIDLIGDLSRFQIICKVPYPNCFDDVQLARRVEVDRRYYTWLTALKLIQAYGRSIRSIDDTADTYILDESIDKFLQDAKSMIPTWFTEALVKV